MRMRSAALLPLIAAACTTTPEAKPPPAEEPPTVQAKAPTRLWPETRREEILEQLHGAQVADPYRWLEDEKAEPVKAWMSVQDGKAREVLQTLPGRDALAKRFKELYYVDSVSAPVKRGKRFFYMRTHADKEKAILYWKEGADGAEKVLLDPNGWSADGTVSLGRWVPSWDGSKLVFQKKPNAADEAILHVIDVATGKLSDVDVIEGGKYAGPSWTPDGRGFYYEWLPVDPAIPVSERPGYTEIRYHALGTDPKSDQVVHPRTGNPSSFLSTGLSRDGRYLFAVVDRGWTENDVFIRDLKKDKAFRPLVLGKGARYDVEVWKDQLYIQTDEGASNLRIFKVAASRPDRANWKEIVPEDKDAALRGFAVVGNHLVLAYLKNASSELRVTTLDGKAVRTIPLPGIGSVGTVLGLQDEDEAYFDFSSFTQPKEVYRTSIKTGKVDLWASVKVPIDPEPYTVEQVWYPSKDGTKVPMFVVRRKDLKKDGSHPTLVYGYGGFNISLTPSFRASIYPWLDAGGIYVVANLRGGGEFGKAWHDSGRGHVKQNVFDDFTAAAEFLVKEGYTRPEKLAIYGGSNGGLLVGAAMTQRPDLYRAVVCAVPLLDMVRYHLFGSGRTWIPEYGTAEKAEDFAVLKAYSPYHNVKEGTKYPALLMMSADHDDRVDPRHARKFVAAVQHATGSEHPVLLRIEQNAGHGGADQVAKAIESSADMYAFLMKELGLAPAAPAAAEEASAK